MDLAAVIERYRDRFLAQYGHRLTRDQRRALAATLACRGADCGELLASRK
jgi:hypothetical protein